MDIAEKRLPQDGRIKMQVKLDNGGRKEVDMRDLVPAHDLRRKDRLPNPGPGDAEDRPDQARIRAGVARGVQEGHRSAVGNHPGHRADGKRQDEHPLLGHLHPERAGEKHHDRRRPGRVLHPGHQPGQHQGRDRPRLSHAPCGRSCARTPTSCSSARCATSRPWTSPSRPPSPATSSSPPFTPTTRRARSSG